MAKRQRKRQWTPKRVYQTNKLALAVWFILCEDGRVMQTPTRTHLADALGIKSLDLISGALTVLHDAGWLYRHIINRVGESGTPIRLLRLELLRKPQKTGVYGRRSVYPNKLGYKYTPKNWGMTSSKEEGVGRGALEQRPGPPRTPTLEELIADKRKRDRERAEKERQEGGAE
jgi:hypothetical protein